MRRVSLEAAQPGMILARAIIGGAGHALLQAGVEIKPQYLTYLHKLGIEFLYVQDNRTKDVEVDDVISENTRSEARALVKSITNGIKTPGKIKKGLAVDDRDLINTVTKIIDELISNKHMIAQLIDIRSKTEYLFAHSVNTAVLATLAGAKMNLTKNRLMLLATGALLHDIGMITIPEHILDKKSELTADEISTIRTHPLYGFEIFKKSKYFDARSGAVILQHHERYHGDGYPRGLKGDKINLLAHITAIADSYDALTSDRPYRKAYLPHEAVEIMMSLAGEHFDSNILSNFLTVIAAYPVGFHVRLSNGESGLVIANDTGHTLRPKVRVLYTGEDLAPHHSPYDLDLSETPHLTITDVVN